MATITLSTDITGEGQGSSKVWKVKAWVSEMEGFTSYPGPEVLVAFVGPDLANYHYKVASPADMYNYPADTSDGSFPYFRRSWLYRTFSHLYEASEFKDNLDAHLSGFASDWESLHTATPQTEDEEFAGGTLHISRKSATSTTAQHEDGTYARYLLVTLTVTLTDSDDVSVFVPSSEGTSLERVATYDDMSEIDEEDRLSSITFCVDSSYKETELLSAIEDDLVNLASELSFMS